MQRTLLAIILVLFGVLTTLALMEVGYWGLFAQQLQSFAGGQVLIDLFIAVTLAMLWMWHDAKATGRNVWPWITLSLVAGSFGPLLYLLTRKPAADKW
jgi:Terpene cyclase DEP1